MPQPHRVDPPMADIAALDREDLRSLGGPGLRTFLNIVDAWGLSEPETLLVLGRPGRSTFYGWAAKARNGGSVSLPLDVLLRISAVLGIHKALRILFDDSAQAVAWLRSPHEGLVFGGQPPMSLVTSGTQDGLLTVRRYLDAWRGGLFASPDARVDGAEPITDDDIVFL